MEAVEDLHGLTEDSYSSNLEWDSSTLEYKNALLDYKESTSVADLHLLVAVSLVTVQRLDLVVLHGCGKKPGSLIEGSWEICTKLNEI